MSRSPQAPRTGKPSWFDTVLHVVMQPIYWSAYLLHRLFGNPTERRNRNWEERLNYRWFVQGMPALVGAALAVVAAGMSWRETQRRVEVYADAAGTYDLPQALAVGRELTRLGVGFFEMPIAPEYVDGYATLASKLDIPLALDSLPNRYRSLEFLKRGALHVLFGGLAQ